MLVYLAHVSSNAGLPTITFCTYTWLFQHQLTSGLPACAAELQVSTAEAQSAQEQAIKVQAARALICACIIPNRCC